MFKSLGVGRRLFGLTRLPLRVHSQALHDPSITIRKVRFYQPFRPRRFITSCIAFGVGYQIFVNVALAPLDKLADELEAEDTEQGNVDEEEEEDHSIFLPIPGTIKKVEPKPYKGTDPEWQEFVKFSKSKELNDKVRADLAYLVQKICEKTIAPQLGAAKAKDIKLNRYWLDVDYPHSPPPEFERSGIEILFPFNISITKMPIDSLTVFRLRHVLWPSALTQSTLSFWKVLLSQNSEKLYEILGLQTKPEQQKMDQLLTRVARMPKPDKDLRAKDHMSGSTTRNPEDSQQPQTPSQSGPRNAMKNISDDRSKAIVKTPGKTETERVAPETSNPTFVGMKIHILRAFVAFRTKLGQTWRPAPSYPPRGSLFVSGFVELSTPRAWVVVDVRAAWDPKSRTFDQRSMVLQVRRLQPKSQPPRG